MLHLHRAVRADALADALAELLSESPVDPFAPEVVAVPTRGMERWLTQRMSSVLGARPGRADGICANVEFPSPHRLVTDAVAAASGIDPAEDPWLPERSVWPLLTVVEESLREPWLSTLAAYLGADTAPSDPMRPARQSRRLTTVRHLAGLFDRYSLHRPEMLAAWARGADLDAAGNPLPAAAAWQAELWRRLRARIGVPDLAERTGGARRRITADPGLVELPSRLALFGLTRLPAGHLEILRALAEGRDLHLFLLHPSPSLWEQVTQRADRSVLAGREDDRTVTLAANRLLASWGRDSREMQLVLTAGASPPSDAHHASPPAPDTLLGRIQQGVRDNRAAPGAPLPGAADERPPLAADDRSIEIHSCHGRARQVEVIRDAILHVLAEDHALEPRDVIVMCPDIETFAPLIQATFGAGETASGAEAGEPSAPSSDGTGTSPIDLRVRLADRSLRQTNPVLGVVAQLLELAEQRLTASQLLDLADRGPVRRRFRLDDDDITRLADWISQAGIRWGLDAPHRAPYKLDALDSGTWQAGLHRLLLGVTMTEDGQRLFAGVLPLDDVDSRAIDLAGRFTELVTRVGQAVRALNARQTLADWAEAIAQAADALDRHRQPRPLAARRAPAGARRARLRGRRRITARARARRGARAPGPAAGGPPHPRQLPHRPSHRLHPAADALGAPSRRLPARARRRRLPAQGPARRRRPHARPPAPGRARPAQRGPTAPARRPAGRGRAPDRHLQRQRRAHQRAASGGRPGRRAARRGRRHRALRGWRPGARRRSWSAIRCSPSTRATSSRGRSPARGPWSFDSAALAGARALAGPRSEPRPFLTAALPQRPAAVVELADLVRFVEHPVRAFMRQRLGISLYSAADEIEDELSVELDGLQRWGVGQRLLEARLRGIEARTAILAEIARGTLPPGVLGKPVIDDVSPIVAGIVDRAQTVVAEVGGAGGIGVMGGDPIDVRVALDDGRAAQRHGDRRQRRPAAGHHLLPGVGQAPDRRLGAAAGAHRQLARATVRGGDGRPRPRARTTSARRGSSRSAPTPPSDAPWRGQSWRC